MDITLVSGIGPEWLEGMKASDIGSVYELVECSPGDLAKRVGIPEETALALIGKAKEVLLLVKELMLSGDRMDANGVLAFLWAEFVVHVDMPS